MKDPLITMSPNIIAQYLEKNPEEFTKEDLIKYIEGNEIRMVNFRFVGGDGRLKTINFIINSKAHLDQLLSAGERVDGSSLFSYIDSTSSDLYVIPRYKTAYLNPFSSIPAIDILCSYYTSDGSRLPSSPENIARKAHEALKSSTGLNLEAMGELEYYIFSDRQHQYPSMSQEGYEESSPFSKWESLRCEAIQAIAQAGGKIKYAHSEVGSICGEDHDMEQHEIEFLPVPLEDAADQVVIARWALRMIGYKYGVTISFAPKILVGQAGNGLHIHTKLVEDGTNVLVEENQLSGLAKRAVAGYLNLASSLTAFGNTVPISYLRLVPHQEAPTLICWGDRNRNVLVRVPLGWIGAKNMAGDANPQDEGDNLESTSRQTVEFRCPDGSADIYLLLAGLAVAARYGLEREAALEEAEKLYVDAKTFFPETGNIQDGLPKLPASCWESAECLLKDREIYQRDGVFPEAVIEGIVKKLKSFNDKDLSGQISGKEDEIKKLVDKYLHC